MKKNIDWDALMVAVVSAAMVLGGLCLSVMVFVVVLVFAMAFNGLIYWGFMAIVFAILTRLFYKYEKSVNEEDTDIPMGGAGFEPGPYEE